VIGADLEGLRLTHDEADLGGLLVLEQLHSARSAFLPLVPLLVEAVELGLPAVYPHGVKSKPSRSDRSGSGKKATRRGDSHIKEHVLVLLAGGDGDLLQLDDGRDLGAGVLLLGSRRGFLPGRAVLRWVGHGAVVAAVAVGCSKGASAREAAKRRD
jgi:hypothetical protein